MNTIYILLCDKTYYDWGDTACESDPECFSGAFSTEAKAKEAILEEYNKHYEGLIKSEHNISAIDDFEIESWKEEWENTEGYWLHEYYVIKVTIDKLWNGD